MGAIVWLCLLWLTATCKAQSPNATAPAIKTTYDEPSNRTTVETPPIAIKSANRSDFCKATYTYSGKTPKRPEKVAFEIWTTNPTRVWTTFIGRLLWSADNGKALTPSELTVRDEGANKITEVITCELPITLFQAIFHSPQVAIAVYGLSQTPNPTLQEDYRLGAQELAPFRALLGTIPGGKLTGNPEDDVLELPFKSVFSYMVVQAEVNSRGPFNFIVDTGAPTSISRKLATEMKLKLEGNETAHTPGGHLDFSLASDISLLVGNLPGNFDKMPVVPIESISPYLGMRIDGILGNDFLRRMTVEIDYDKKVILLCDPKSYSFKPDKDSTALPLSFTHGGLPIVSTTLKQGGKSFTGNFAIDTGSSGSISIFETFLKRTGLRELIPRTSQMRHGSSGVTLSGGSNAVYGRIAEARLGDFDIEAPQVELNEDSDTGTRLGCDGLLGTRVLRRFHIVLDYSRKRVILTKGTLFEKPDRGASAGLMLIAQGDEFYPFKVEGVLENSPAADADLRAGDAIVTIDGAPTKGLTLEEVQNKLDQGNHESVVTIQRDTATLQVKLKPRKLLG